MLSCEILQIFKNTIFYRIPLVGASGKGHEGKNLAVLSFNIGINHRCFRKMPIKKNNEITTIAETFIVSLVVFEAGFLVNVL